jgi:hypothetical protein
MTTRLEKSNYKTYQNPLGESHGVCLGSKSQTPGMTYYIVAKKNINKFLNWAEDETTCDFLEDFPIKSFTCGNSKSPWSI